MLCQLNKDMQESSLIKQQCDTEMTNFSRLALHAAVYTLLRPAYCQAAMPEAAPRDNNSNMH